MAIDKYFNLNTSLGSKDEDELIEGLRYVGEFKMKKIEDDMKRSYGKDAPAGFSGKLSCLDNKFDGQDYNNANKVALDSLLKYCAKRAGFKEPNEQLYKGRARRDSLFMNTFFNVISEAVAPIIPAYVSYFYDYIADVRHVGFGDNAHFMIPNRDIFQV